MLMEVIEPGKIFSQKGHSYDHVVESMTEEFTKDDCFCIAILEKQLDK
jgi:hypothetical protein